MTHVVLARTQKKGIVLILVGLALAITAFPFARREPFTWYPLTSANPGLMEQIRHLDVIIRQGKGSPDQVCQHFFGAAKGTEAECRVAYQNDPRPEKSVILPYRYIFAASVVSLFVGIGMVALGMGSKTTPDGSLG